MAFSDEMARIQRAVAQCRDIVLRYSQVLEALQLRRGERVLEVGCGGGFLTFEVAQLNRTRFLGTPSGLR
jgi:cyclopropane fatty-acyl-phospholipid synthase-like methyltransferase